MAIEKLIAKTKEYNKGNGIALLTKILIQFKRWSGDLNYGLQWGSEIQTCPDFEWSIFVQSSNGLDFKWFSQPGLFLSINKILLIFKMVQIKSTIFPLFEWSGPFEIQLYKDHLKSDLLKVWILYVYGPDFERSDFRSLLQSIGFYLVQSLNGPLFRSWLEQRTSTSPLFRCFCNLKDLLVVLVLPVFLASYKKACYIFVTFFAGIFLRPFLIKKNLKKFGKKLFLTFEEQTSNSSQLQHRIASC